LQALIHNIKRLFKWELNKRLFEHENTDMGRDMLVESLRLLSRVGT
jgi:hypothetical protein